MKAYTKSHLISLTLCVYVCTHTKSSISLFVCMCICLHVCMYVCWYHLYVYLFVCVYVSQKIISLTLCLYVCVCVMSFTGIRAALRNSGGTLKFSCSRGSAALSRSVCLHMCVSCVRNRTHPAGSCLVETRQDMRVLVVCRHDMG